MQWFYPFRKWKMHPLEWLQDLNPRQPYCFRGVFLISAILVGINFKVCKKCWKDISHY
jgi:hypothetical protein